MQGPKYTNNKYKGIRPMKITFLGVSSGLTAENEKFHSNMLLEGGISGRMLIDCGSDIRHSMHGQGYSHAAIDSAYISHLHADHVGGLEWLAFSKFFLDNKKLALYISPDQRDRLWNNVLSGGMSTIENTAANLETFFDVMPIDNLSFTWEKYTFKLIKSYHTISNSNLFPSYGLLIYGDTKKIFITTDSRFCPEKFLPIYNEADIIFQDCETSEWSSKQHAHYNDLKTLDPGIKEKMWLYHYNDGPLPDAKLDGFQGFVKIGQSFDF
jgi:ribonuclease BN (tRNA processing enzyme)